VRSSFRKGRVVGVEIGLELGIARRRDGRGVVEEDVHPRPQPPAHGSVVLVRPSRRASRTSTSSRMWSVTSPRSSASVGGRRQVRRKVSASARTFPAVTAIRSGSADRAVPSRLHPEWAALHQLEARMGSAINCSYARRRRDSAPEPVPQPAPRSSQSRSHRESQLGGPKLLGLRGAGKGFEP
jgi:hypothetical protein